MKALIALGVLGGIAAWSGSVAEANPAWLAVTIPTGLLSIWLVLCYIGSIWGHIDDLGSLAAKDVRIAAAEKRLEDVKALAADKHGLPESLLALQQDDNPVTHYMSIVSRAIQNVEQEMGYKARIEGRIAARAAGPFSLVVTIFGSSVSI